MKELTYLDRLISSFLGEIPLSPATTKFESRRISSARSDRMTEQSKMLTRSQAIPEDNITL
jgi:hypothetical protein